MGVVGVYLCTLSVRPPPLHRYLFVNELVKLQPQTINGNAVETVNARELHTFLESKQDFSTWIKNRIEKYEFVENADYLLHKFMEQTPSGAKHKTDYYVSVGMAKELAMVENNDKGKEARRYFIECEKRLKGSMTRLSYAQALRAYADEVEAREKLEQQLALAEPKVEYFDALVNRNLLLNFTTVAKELGVKRKVLIGYLLENNYIYRDANNTLLPYSQHTPHLFEVKEYTKDNYAGVQTLVTPRGRETFRLLLSGLPSV